MRFRKLAACAAAIMCAAAITAVPTSATLTTVTQSGYVRSSDQSYLVMVYSDGTKDASEKAATNYGIDLTAIASVEVTVACDIQVEAAAMGDVGTNKGTFTNDWGGALVMSSVGTDYNHNWNGKEYWGVNDPDVGYTAADKPITFNKVADGEYKAVLTLGDDNKVESSCYFCQFCIQNWGADNATVKSIVMKDASGNVIISYDENGKANLDLVTADTKKEETKKEETKAEETKKEETKKEDTKKEETQKTDTKKEETKKEETKKEDPQSGEFTAEFGAQFNSALGDEWPSFADQTVKFDYGKESTISIDMGSKVGFGGNYIAVNTNVPYVEGISSGKITSFKLDGKEIPLKDTYINGEGTDGGVRLTILNLWNDQIETQPLDTADLPETFQTIDISFVVDTPAETEVSADEAEVDWSQWDEAAAKENNENFQLGGKIDLLAAVGEGWDDFTKVEADFTWDAGTGWCGGAGIGGGATLADGTSWIAGPEFGAANANEGVVNDGKATQTIIDMNGETLATIASVNDDGTSSFGELQVQNWWNGTEANAKVAAIRFLDATGSVIKELRFDGGAAAEVTTVSNVAAAADKENPATGVEDVAAVAGLAVVAAGAMIISKKRK